MNGWLKLHRKILDSRQFANPIELKVWIWLMCKASTQDRHVTLKVGSGYHSVTIKKGQLIFGRSSAERELKIDGSTVYKVIQRLQDNNDILIQSNNHFSIITITNWSEYQSNESIEDFEIIDDVTAKEQPDSSQIAATEQPDSSNVTQYKKVKKEKNVNKVKKDQESGKLFQILLPWDSPVFAQAWQVWKDYRQAQHRYKFKSEQVEQITLNDLCKISNNDEATAIEIIHLAISKSWKGLYPLKTPPNGNKTNFSTNGASRVGTGEARNQALKDY